MKSIILIIILAVVATSCLNKSNNSVNNKVTTTKSMCDKLYGLIDANDSGVLPDSIFKPKADSLRIAIDFSAGDMTVAEWDSIKQYETKLLDELKLKKVDRDKQNKAE